MSLAKNLGERVPRGTGKLLDQGLVEVQTFFNRKCHCKFPKIWTGPLGVSSIKIILKSLSVSFFS
jgi:hypothetical protein